MPNQVNSSVSVSSNEITTYYFFSPKHRGNPTTEISIWRIEVDNELDCFSNCLQNEWYVNDIGWGCISTSLDKFSILGENLINKELIIAKFIVDQNQWHGYPADVRRKPKDKPLPKILFDWFEKGIVSKSMLARIKQGQI